MRPHWWRDILAGAAGMTPQHGWSWPSEVGGRFRVDLADQSMSEARRFLREQGLDEWAEVIFSHPYTTAVAIAAKLRREVDSDKRENSNG